MTYDPSAARSSFTISDNPNYPGVFICYINGNFVPIVGFELTYGVWQIPEFTIHMVPDILIQGLGREDRVQVALFYLDHWHGDSEFRLLVDGEIVGQSWGKSHGQRVHSFVCLAHIQLLNSLYFFFMNTLDDVVSAQDPSIRSTGLTEAGLFYPYSIFHKGLFTPSGVGDLQGNAPAAGRRDYRIVDTTGVDDTANPNDDPIAAPFELLYNCIKGMIGNTVPENRRAVPAVNFFARAVRRNRLWRRFVRLPILEDIANLTERKGVFPIFAAARSDEALAAMQRQVAGSVANSGSVWDMLKSVLQIVNMEIAMIPNAGCFQTNLECEIVAQFNSDNTNLRTQALPNQTDALGQETVSEEAQRSAPQGYNPQQPASLAQYFVKPPFWFGMTPASNVVYPSMIDNYGGQERYDLQPTRLYVQDSVMTQALRAQGPQRDFMLHALTVAWPPEADLIMHRQVGESGGANPNASSHTLTGKNLLIWPEEFYKGPVVARMQLPRWFQFLQQMRNSPGNVSATGITGASTTPGVTSSTGAPSTATPGAQTSTQNPAVALANTVGVPGPPNLHNRGDLNITDPSEIRSTPIRDTRNMVINTASRTAVTPSAGPVVSTRGRVRDPRFLTATDLWEMDEETLAIVRGRRRTDIPYHTNKNPRSPEFISLAMIRNMIGGSRQGRVKPGIQALANYVLRHFQVSTRVGNYRVDWISSYGYERPEGGPNQSRITQDLIDRFVRKNSLRAEGPLPESEVNVQDSHHEGRAFDCAVRLTGQRTGTTAVGTPIANWLARNAHHLGVQNIVWGRRAFFCISNPNTRFGNLGPERAFADASNAHVDHIHFEVNNEGANGTLIWYQDPTFQNSLAPPVFTNLENLHLRTVRSFTPTRIRRIPPASTSRGRSTTTVEQQLVIRAQDVPTPDLIANLPQTISVVNGTPSPVTLVRSAQIVLPTRTTEVRTQTTVPVPSATVTPNAVTPNPTPASSPGASPANPVIHNDDSSFQALFRLYAQQEFLRQRYLQRNVGLSLKFNPYIVPGFPCTIFDSQRTREHSVGYVVSVTHSGFIGNGSSATLETKVSVSCVRQLPEFIQDVINDSEYFVDRIAAAPAESIDEIRNVIQKEDKAEEFYRKLFYGGEPRPTGYSAVFNFLTQLGVPEGIDVLALRSEVTETTRTVLPDEGPPPEGETQPTEATRTTTRRVVHNLDPSLELSPLPETLTFQAFDNHHIAMQSASRPVCTLAQYVRFLHGGRTIQSLIATGEVEGEEDYFSYQVVTESDVVAVTTNGRQIRGNSERKTATFYNRIFKLRQGPGDPPTEQQRGYNAHGPSAGTAGLPANYPQTRVDWDEALIAYREKVKRRVSPAQ